jgi:hypothetical protein
MLSISLKNISLSVREYLENVSASLFKASRRCYLGVFFASPLSSISPSSLEVCSCELAVLENLLTPCFFSLSSFSMCFLINSSISSPYSPLLSSCESALIVLDIGVLNCYYCVLILVLVGGFISSFRKSESFFPPLLPALEVRLYSSSTIFSSSSSEMCFADL